MTGLRHTCQSARTKILYLLLVIFLLITVIVLAIELARQYNHGDDGEDKPDGVCLSSTCIRTANRINEALDRTVSPCDNFYKFACGGWEKKNRLPFYKSYAWSRYDELETKIDLFFRDQLEKPVASSSFEPFVKARTLYHICIDTYELDDLGLFEVYNLIKSIGGIWSNTSLPYPEFDLTERLLQLASMDSYPLVDIKYDFNRYNASQLLMQLDMPKPPILFSRQENEEMWQAVADSYLHIWDDLNAFTPMHQPSHRDFWDMYNIMNSLKVLLDDTRLVSETVSWNATLLTVEELKAFVPSVDWEHLFAKMLPDSERVTQVIVPNSEYLIGLTDLINNTWSTRSLDNFLKFMIVLDNLEFFPYKYRKVNDDIVYRDLHESLTWHPPPRYQFCVREMNEADACSLGSLVDKIIEVIRETYIDVLEHSDLLDRKASDYATQKIKMMKKHIAFPSSITNDTALTNMYSKVFANSSSSFFVNVMKTRTGIAFTSLCFIGYLTEKEKNDIWLDQIFVVNGYYSPNMNRFAILAGIIQEIFYDYGNPNYVNFASMGFTIGHEFTHGVDEVGMQYGIDGEITADQMKKSSVIFSEIKQCLVEQYGKLGIRSRGSTDTDSIVVTNSVMTLDENIADNGGSYVAEKAYELLLKRHGPEPLLPTPHLESWQQMYYVVQAQVECSLLTEPGWYMIANNAEHSQQEVRVNGVLQNSRRFSESFRCPLGSFMNPYKKCTVW